MIWLVTGSNYLLTVILSVTDIGCDGNFNSDWDWVIYVIGSDRLLTVILTVIVIDTEWLRLWWFFCQWQTVIVIVTENHFLCDCNSDSDCQWLCLSLRVIASVMVILTVTYSDLACHWEWLPFNNDSLSDRQWLLLSLRGISFVIVILIVMVSDCLCH